jgi:hypothetical protein
VVEIALFLASYAMPTYVHQPGIPEQVTIEQFRAKTNVKFQKVEDDPERGQDTVSVTGIAIEQPAKLINNLIPLHTTFRPFSLRRVILVAGSYQTLPREILHEGPSARLRAVISGDGPTSTTDRVVSRDKYPVPPKPNPS